MGLSLCGCLSLSWCCLRVRRVSCVRQSSEVLFGKWLSVRGSAGPPQLLAGTSGPSLNMAQVCLMCLWRSHTRRFMIPNVCFHFTCTHMLAGSFVWNERQLHRAQEDFFCLCPLGPVVQIYIGPAKVFTGPKSCTFFILCLRLDFKYYTLLCKSH